MDTHFTIIPKIALINRFGSIPESVEVDNNAWEDYWNDRYDGKKSQPDFEDAFTIKWWENVDIDIKSIEGSLDGFLKRSSDSVPQALHWNSAVSLHPGHEVWIYNNGSNISEFTVKIDLKFETRKFLSDISNLLKEIDTVLMDKYGSIINPGGKDILKHL